MIVLKIGGSLYQSECLNEWLTKLVKDLDQPIVIVPGGGPFADQVRKAAAKWQLASHCAHDMAVMGMQQFAHLMQGLNNKLPLINSVPELHQVDKSNYAVIWAPYNDLVNADDIEKDWQTTSDSLAVWLAGKLAAEHLCLVKSAPVTGKLLSQLVDAEVVDNNFSKWVSDFPGKVHFYHATEAQKFIDHLANGVFS